MGGERRVGDTRERKSYEFIFRILELAAQGRSSKLRSQAWFPCRSRHAATRVMGNYAFMTFLQLGLVPHISDDSVR